MSVAACFLLFPPGARECCFLVPACPSFKGWASLEEGWVSVAFPFPLLGTVGAILAGVERGRDGAAVRGRNHSPTGAGQAPAAAVTSAAAALSSLPSEALRFFPSFLPAGSSGISGTGSWGWRRAEENAAAACKPWEGGEVATVTVTSYRSQLVKEPLADHVTARGGGFILAAILSACHSWLL